MSFKETLSKEKYNLLKQKSLEEKVDKKVVIRGALWAPELGYYEKGDFLFICRKGDLIYEIPANIQIVLNWKGYKFPYNNVSMKPLSQENNRLLLINLPLTRCMVIPKPISIIPFQQKIMLEFDNTKIEDIAILGGQGRLIVGLNNVAFFNS